MPKRCELVRFTTTDGKPAAAFICGGAPGKPTVPNCEFCRRPGGSGVRQCDHYVGGANPDGTKKTCDRYLCLSCTARRGDFDYCPDHREANGFPAPVPGALYNMANCRWIDTRYVSLCLAKLDDRCARSMGPGKRCLYLPKERAVICESCGLQLTGHPSAQASLL